MRSVASLQRMGQGQTGRSLTRGNQSDPSVQTSRRHPKAPHTRLCVEAMTMEIFEGTANMHMRRSSLARGAVPAGLMTLKNGGILILIVTYA